MPRPECLFMSYPDRVCARSEACFARCARRSSWRGNFNTRSGVLHRMPNLRAVVAHLGPARLMGLRCLALECVCVEPDMLLQAWGPVRDSRLDAAARLCKCRIFNDPTPDVMCFYQRCQSWVAFMPAETLPQLFRKASMPHRSSTFF